ncbi:hypothetical protein GPECTOR_12g383 [Gonium pectorale]|uniref:Uncharacterized protein n=1 Tax=Gonium pectorale TaxID=33097 RepID=A0A150GNP9_GONPE|nr:hypothetical protein GPECTOR_12g383 [Gonium pectorale]|eukprot:KXZ51421.1 hypothetical protein GPECTOR_12g383 [Gonium pectorale]
MALPSPILSAGRPILALAAQAMGTVTGRGFASSATPQPPPKRPTSIVEPTYTYMPPGSSLREPLYFSTSDPVYFVDPKPDPAAATATAQTQAPAGEEKAKPMQARPQGPAPKIDFSSISGKSADDGQKVSYRMSDEMAQQPYVVNPNTHSMREPKYVSISDPKYTSADKAKK